SPCRCQQGDQRCAKERQADDPDAPEIGHGDEVRCPSDHAHLSGKRLPADRIAGRGYHVAGIASRRSPEIATPAPEDDGASSIEYIRAGKLRALAVTTAMRSEALANPGKVNMASAGNGSPAMLPANFSR